jgi:hypothetical protein
MPKRTVVKPSQTSKPRAAKPAKAEKPYIVINTVNGDVMGVHTRPNADAARLIAVEMAAEQYKEVSSADVHAELVKDGDWISPDGEVRIFVRQADS